MANAATEPTPEEFENALFVRAQEPPEVPDPDSITITKEEFFASTDPVDVAVLIFWRFVEKDGQQPTARAVWERMAGKGMNDDDGQPLRLETVEAAIERLAANGIVPRGGESL